MHFSNIVVCGTSRVSGRTGLHADLSIVPARQKERENHACVRDDPRGQSRRRQLLSTRARCSVPRRRARQHRCHRAANQVHDKLGVDVSYVVANPSSYAWPDSTRPRATALPADVAALPPGYIAPISANPPAPFGRFGDSDDCTMYDDWPYGFKNRSGYTAKISDDQLKKQLASRPTTYLVGELDILPLYGFDGSCPAMAQGPTRLARGLASAAM